MENRLPLRVSLGLVLAVFAAYFPVMYANFINFDDADYVYNNPHVKTGLTRENIVWAWTSFHAANWHPLTWMSHQLDCQLFDLRPRPHHLVALGWHIANTVCLYLVLRRMTGEEWRPALVAALFGLHPLHVESVAWVSERKDVSSTFFAIATLGAYTLYAARPSAGRYMSVLALFTLGLLCKPMLVTWPFVLLLVDYWPLRRTPLLLPKATEEAARFVPAGWLRLVLEKLPLLALAAASSIVTMKAQALAMKSSEHLSLWFRLGNAVVSYATYLRKMIWPTDLAAFYRHQGSRLPLAPVVISAVVLLLVSLVVLLGYRKRPVLLVGWLWYLGTLVPVIGLVQVGIQSMADRYTYIPLIGIFMALAWSVPFPPRRPALNISASFGISLVVLLCALLTFRQAWFWHDSDVLWLHALQVDENPITRCYYASALYNDAAVLYDDAEELKQKGHVAEAERRVAEAKARMAETERQCEIALQLDPTERLPRARLAEYRIFRGDLDGAFETLSEGVDLDPQSAALHNLLGRVLAYKGRIQEASLQFREACRLYSESGVLHFDLGTALFCLGDREEAQGEREIGRRLEPDFTEQMRKYAESFLGRTDPRRHCPSAAVFHAQEACWSSPEPQAVLYQTLAEAYADAGQSIAAYISAQRALNLAETNGRTDLLTDLRHLIQSVEPVALQKGAQAAALLFATPIFDAHPGAIGTFAFLGFDFAVHCFPHDFSEGHRVNDR